MQQHRTRPGSQTSRCFLDWQLLTSQRTKVLCIPEKSMHILPGPQFCGKDSKTDSPYAENFRYAWNTFVSNLKQVALTYCQSIANQKKYLILHPIKQPST